MKIKNWSNQNACFGNLFNFQKVRNVSLCTSNSTSRDFTKKTTNMSTQTFFFLWPKVTNDCNMHPQVNGLKDVQHLCDRILFSHKKSKRRIQANPWKKFYKKFILCDSINIQS